MIELLAPAGDKEKLEVAFNYGADAVYFGGQNFSLRANANNFSLDEIEQATKYAHSLNKKVYVTVNIVFHNEDLDGLENYLKFLNQVKVDGIIASDIIVIKMVNELKLQIPIVLSTQDSVLNAGAVRFWQNLGVKRIVLAREASRDNIKQIIDETGVEIETFVHGAMCTSVSGKCVLSNYMTLRDSNRGGCAQICRWNFKVDDCPDFTMTSKDLNMIQNIEDMINIGIVSFKVEGRMRGIYYIATVLLTYRRIIDGIINKTLTDDDKIYYLNVLNRCANRDSKPQFYNGKTEATDEYWNNNVEITNKDFLGIVTGYDSDNKLVLVEQRNYFKVGDTIQFFGPDIETFNYEVHIIYNEFGDSIDVANHAQMKIKLPLDRPIAIGDMLRVKVFDKSHKIL